MNIKHYIYLSAAIAFSLSSCSDDNGIENDFEPKTYNVLGKVEKGPFVSGSTITIQPMDGNLQVQGSMYSSTIQDDFGNFSFGSKLFETPYAELTANGYFFNEVEGYLSEGTLNLRALVDLSDKTTVNVNLFTHLKYQRIQKLIAEGMKFGEANKQAQTELFTEFGLQKYTEKDASTFSITEGTDEAAALIAISSLLIVDKSEAEITEYLAKLSKEFGEKGAFSESTKRIINEDKKSLNYEISYIEDNIVERYKSLGIDVEVKELKRFIDWDNDGIAGNEMLQEGQEVILETTELNVPNEGGVYTIKITSPVPVYLEPPFNSDGDLDIIQPDNFFDNLYEETSSVNISMENSLANNTLTVKIKPLESRKPKTSEITIYDGLNNVVGNIKVTQEGNSNSSIPKLGEAGDAFVNSIAASLAQSFSELNLIEQYYHYNKEKDFVRKYVTPSSSTIRNIWSEFYETNRGLMVIKDADAERLGVYQEYFDVFSAMQYYNMVVAWGDVPYINFVPDFVNIYIGRTPQNKIFTDLKTNLEKAIDYLEEKRNESLGNDINEFFFLSKDIARILLANIYMYEGNYSQAERLLKKVIGNGFYALDASNYNDRETISNLFHNGSSNETIFAIRNQHGNLEETGNITTGTPKIVPIMTYTDVILSYAECLYKNDKISEAEKQLSQVVNAKGITISGNYTLEKIKDARLQLMLYTNTNFAFMKRNNFAKDVYGIEKYRQLLPIPQQELNANSSMTQNPGY